MIFCTLFAFFIASANAVAVSGDFTGEALTVRAEYALLLEVPELRTQAAYVEAAWMLGGGFQIAGRVEGSWTRLDGFGTDSPYLRHREAALGVNYWFAPELVVKASYHFVDGARFAFEPWDGTGTRPSPEAHTQLFVLGAQFAL